MSPLPARTTLRGIAIGAYLFWLVAVVLYMAGRYTAFPLLMPARTGMVVGTGFLTLFGAVRILRDGLRRLQARL